MAAQGLGAALQAPPAAQGLQALQQGLHLAAQGFLVAQGLRAAHGLLAQGLAAQQPTFTAQGLQPALHCWLARHCPRHGEQGVHPARAAPPPPNIKVIRAADHQVAR
ncbi:hypothetical protein [Marinobacter sp. SS21]|uniref:hypothetical protein n=1 Tax=Marinobacter sp. SS21 TaxID=2979460 RepID=UPI00232DACE8|nr:hypothetical protein [Marinobacter sp. SS21]MDC0661085.1 hypothetical protein [Marinobacter sp. SS21]